MNERITTVQDALKHPEVFRVSIFGSAQTKPGDPEYQLVEKLAYELGRREISVVTGGGPGQMEAANRQLPMHQRELLKPTDPAKHIYCTSGTTTTRRKN